MSRKKEDSLSSFIDKLKAPEAEKVILKIIANSIKKPSRLMEFSRNLNQEVSSRFSHD
jgi:hypothetical protein